MRTVRAHHIGMHRYDRPRRLLACAIAGLAGFVDATGYLAADKYFVSFMSGNTTRLGVDLVTDTGRAFIPALLILGFVTAVTLGALLADAAGRYRKSAVIGVSAFLLSVGALARGMAVPALFLACSVLAMGVLNNAFRRDGEVAIGLTYMTGALVRFGQGLAARLRGRARAGWTTNLTLWLSLAGGAVCGAFSAVRNPQFSPWFAAAFALCLCVAALWIERITPAQSS